jgi:predicted nuclease of predicted toxin-antitoxin system
MRFLLDMGISPVSEAFLLSRGIDAVHLAERALPCLSDPAILDLARMEHRILVAHDLDFGELVAAAALSYPA